MESQTFGVICTIPVSILPKNTELDRLDVFLDKICNTIESVSKSIFRTNLIEEYREYYDGRTLYARLHFSGYHNINFEVNNNVFNLKKELETLGCTDIYIKF